MPPSLLLRLACRPRLTHPHARVHRPQMQCLEPLLAWLAEQSAAAGSPLHGRVALDRLGVAGHSRGAKLAALHFAGAPSAPRALCDTPQPAPRQVSCILLHDKHISLGSPHARGADRPRQIRAAALIDPVDNTDFTPESADYPSAVRALRRAGRPLAITGAGVVGRCNPPGSNFQALLLPGLGVPTCLTGEGKMRPSIQLKCAVGQMTPCIPFSAPGRP